MFENASEFAEKLENEQFTDLIDEPFGTTSDVGSDDVHSSPAGTSSAPSARSAASELSIDESLDEFDLDPIDFDALLLQTNPAPKFTSTSLTPTPDDDDDEDEDDVDSDVEAAVLGFDDTELDMYIQSSSYANAHSRQPMQNYGHGVNGLRQGGYLPHHPQVSCNTFSVNFYFPCVVPSTDSLVLFMLIILLR